MLPRWHRKKRMKIMYCRKYNKLIWCNKYLRNAIVIIVGISILGILFIKGGGVQANAQNFQSLAYDSTEARHRLLELIAEGKLSERDIEISITQSANRQKFLVRTYQVQENLQIQLIPEINGTFTFPCISAWALLFDPTQELVEVVYYLQNDGKSFVQGKSYFSSMEFSLVIYDNFVYENISVPISMKNFIKMPFGYFLEETAQSLHWDWVFPNRNFISINERARNFTAYLEQNFKQDADMLLHQQHDSFNNAIPDKIEDLQIISRRIIKNKEIINNTIYYMLEYIDSLPTDEIQFIPLDDKKRMIPLFDNRYLYIYAENIIFFLKKYPDFYTSVTALDIPFELDNKKSLEYLYSKIYLITAKFPGVWYLVPIVAESQPEEQKTETVVSLAILIPFFNLDGSFEIYGWDRVMAFSAEMEDNNPAQYFRKIEILRVPNKRQRYLE